MVSLSGLEYTPWLTYLMDVFDLFYHMRFLKVNKIFGKVKKWNKNAFLYNGSAFEIPKTEKQCKVLL